MQPRTIACIILNWNSHEETVRCLQALRRHATGDYTLRVVVVDNGSAVFPGDRICAAWPGGIELILLPHNTGFTGGCNAGAASVMARAAEYLLFLNNDTLCKEDFITPLLRAMEADSTLGMVSPIECHLDTGEATLLSVRINLTAGYSQNVLPPLDFDWTTPRLIPSEGIHGGMMLIRTALFGRLQGFDDAFFAYYEDADLALRARGQGCHGGFCISSHVYHAVGASTRKYDHTPRRNPIRACLNARNSILLVRKHAAPGQKLLFFLFHLPKHTLAFLVKHGRSYGWRICWRYLAWVACGIGQPLTSPPSPDMLSALGLR